ncbi:hypothetical protein K488DRAFT_58616, partial [Vararia minispora EC-137]
AIDGERAKAEGTFAGGQRNHCRGVFPALSAGALYGGGQQVHCPPSVAASHRGIVERLLANPHIQRLAGYASEGFAYYFPHSYHHVCTHLRSLHGMLPYLRWPFTNSIYTGATFNLGSVAVTLEHNDHTNYPTIPCSI